jgi:hypothetical protein
MFYLHVCYCKQVSERKSLFVVVQTVDGCHRNVILKKIAICCLNVVMGQRPFVVVLGGFLGKW